MTFAKKAATLIAVLLLGLASAAEAVTPLPTPAKVRLAEDGAPSGAGFYIAEAKGYFRELGIEIEIVSFESSAEMLPAIAAGHVDIAGGITSVALFNAIQRGFDIKIVADKGTNLPGRSYFDLVIRADLKDRIKDYKDLEGLRIAVSAPQSLDHLTLAKALEKGGLTFDDIDLVIIPNFSNMLTALANRALDAALLIEPLITQGVKDGYVDRWKDATDFAPGAQIAIVLASPSFVRDRREVAERFMVAYLRGVRDYYDAFVHGEGFEEILPIMTEYSTLKDPDVYRNMHPPGLNPNGHVLIEGIRSDLDWYIAQGYFSGEVDLARVVDHSLVDYALEVLGWYEVEGE